MPSWRYPVARKLLGISQTQVILDVMPRKKGVNAEDPELAKRLNLLQMSPSFAMRELADGSCQVLQMSEIPRDESVYWVAAQSTLADGSTFDTVVIIANGGGETIKFYMHANGHWFEPADENFALEVEKQRDEIFPFDWSYSIPVSNDTYTTHQRGHNKRMQSDL